MTRAVDPDRVPVYPRRQPSALNSPLSQVCPMNPFGVQQASARPVPVQRKKPPRNLLPKAPPAAAVETIDAGDPTPGRGRKRALSPDSRAAAREVRLMHACARCHKKRERVCHGPLLVRDHMLIRLSAARLDLVALVKARTNAVWTYLACRNCQRIDGHICSLVGHAKTPRII